MKHFSLASSIASVFAIPLRPATLIPLRPTTAALQPSSAFSTTAALLAKKGRPKTDKRITLLRYSLYHPTTLTPRPLRFSRHRSLRHWTIHRAWLLHQRQVRQSARAELERQYQAMMAAMEELRLRAGDAGRLYRQAMVKKGVYGGRSDLGAAEGESGDGRRVEKGREGGVPVEMARGLVDYPPRGGWDHAWTR